MLNHSFFIFKEQSINSYEFDFEKDLFEPSNTSAALSSRLVVNDPSSFAKFLYQQKPDSPYIQSLHQINRIALFFPKFVHGQSYSVAKILRQRFQYQGTILAYGDVALDQIPLLHQLSFQGFHIDETDRTKNWTQLVQSRLALFPHIYMS